MKHFRNGGILKNYWPNLLVVCIFPDLSCLFRNIRTKFVGPLIFPLKLIVVGLGNLRCQYQEVSIVALIVGINRFSAENLKVELQKDRLTDELIWGGLGNLRFLQVNPSLGLFCGTCLHTTSDDDQTRPEHTTQIHSKHHHHGGGSARPSSDMDLIKPHDLPHGWPGGGFGWEVWLLNNGSNYLIKVIINLFLSTYLILI